MPSIRMADGTEIDLPYPKQESAGSSSQPAPTASAMNRASQFVGGVIPSPTGGQARPAGRASLPGGFPAGLDFTNMVGFARTPAGQEVINRILGQIQQAGQGQRRRPPINRGGMM